MGIQALVVFIGLAIALSVGVIAGMLEGRPLAGWLTGGLLPAIWTLLYLVERATGRDIWHYTTPYPYRRTEGASVTAASRLQAAPKRELVSAEANEIRLAA